MQFSEHVVILEQISDEYDYNGISAVRPRDITRIHVEPPPRSRISKRKMFRRKDLLDEVSLLEISAALTMMARRHYIIAAYTELIGNGSPFFCRPIELDDDHVSFRAFCSLKAKIEFDLVLGLEDITRVDSDTKDLRILSRFCETAKRPRKA